VGGGGGCVGFWVPQKGCKNQSYGFTSCLGGGVGVGGVFWGGESHPSISILGVLGEVWGGVGCAAFVFPEVNLPAF